MYFICMMKLILLLCFMSNFSYGTDRNIQFIYDNYCPWSCTKGSSLRPFGFAVDLANLIYLRSAGIEYRSSSFLRALSEVESGRADIISAVYRNKTRKLIYSLPVGITNVSIATKIGKLKESDYSTKLDSLRIGVAKGFVYSKAVEDYQNSRPDHVSVVSSVSAVGQLLKMIDAGRIDLMTDNHEVLVYWKKELKLNEIYISKAPDYLSYKKEIYFAFTDSEKGRKLRDLFNKRFNFSSLGPSTSTD